MATHHPDHHDPFKDYEPLPVIEVRCIRGVLDGYVSEQRCKPEDLRPEISQALICEKNKQGHIGWKNTNEYAVYRLLEISPGDWVYLFYGVEFRDIDVTRGKDLFGPKHWVSIDRGRVEDAVDITR